MERSTLGSSARRPWGWSLWLGLMFVAGAGTAEAEPVRSRVHPALVGASSDTLVVEGREPAPRSGPSLQERWAAPFAVQSSGAPAPRYARPVVVVSDSASARVAAGADSAAAAPSPVPAARPSPPPAASGTAARSASSPAAPAAADVGTRTHRVEWGETWYGIARQYQVTPRDLAAANPDVEPERLRSGQVLRIPRSAGRPSASRTHQVGAGDTLWGIARRYGVSADAIRRANKLSDDRVRLGQTLVIPQEETR